MNYKPKAKETKATKAVYIRTRLIDEVNQIAIETGMSFSEIVDGMIDTCLQSRQAQSEGEAEENKK